MVSPAVLAGQSLPRLVKARAPALQRAATVQAAQAFSPRANPPTRAGPPPFATAATLLEPSWRAYDLFPHRPDERALTLPPRPPNSPLGAGKPPPEERSRPHHPL